MLWGSMQRFLKPLREMDFGHKKDLSSSGFFFLPMGRHFLDHQVLRWVELKTYSAKHVIL